MWLPCPQVLDAPVKILGLELEDFAMSAITPLLVSYFLDVLPSFGLGLLLGLALYSAKRGRPQGALLHLLHGLELTRLPGLLPPTTQRYSAW